MTLSLRQATRDDTPLLARMNKHLIEDEGHRNPMSLAQLAARMMDFLSGEYRADLILDEERVVGYALYRVHPDDFDPSRPVVYLRQYFIEREERRKSYGRLALELLREERFGPEAEVVIDVLATNSTGQHFWESAAFIPYAITMKLPPVDS